jgi:hypothetical protein
MQRSFNQGIFDISSTQKEALGTLRITPDGRKFRYAKAGATALSAGYMGVAVAGTALHINRSVAAAAAIGDKSVIVTVGASAVTADQYKDGFLQINDGTGQGHNYPIDGNTAISAAGGDVTVSLKDPIKVALVASATSEVSLIPNPWYAVTEGTTQEKLPVGVAPVAVTAAYYYWAQTGGVAICAVDGTPAVGSYLILSDANAGFLEVRVTALDVDEPALAITFATAGVDGEFKPCYLLID